MNVIVIEYRTYAGDDDVLAHVASTWETAEAWMREHPNLDGSGTHDETVNRIRRQNYWFWVSEEEVDGTASTGEARTYDRHGVLQEST